MLACVCAGILQIFRGLSLEVMNELYSRAQAMYVLAKQIVFKEDEPGHEMYMIIEGQRPLHAAGSCGL